MTTPSRRATRAAAAAAVLAAALAPAPAVLAAPTVPEGLYGTQDPTYDGAFRQGMTLVALTAADREPADTAVGWLTRQQCADGGYVAFRAETSKPCDASTEDTNSTAMAVQGLVAVSGRGDTKVDQAVAEAMDWLVAQQNADGGVGYNPGGATDANSTALLVEAVRATGEDPSRLQAKGKSPVDALTALQLGCDAPRPKRGAFAFQSDGSGPLLPNDNATAAAVRALSGSRLLVEGAEKGVTPAPLDCKGGGPSPQESAGAGAAYLAHRLDAHDGTIPPLQGKTPDYFTTANAGLALAASGDEGAARETARTLEGKLAAYVVDENGKDRPAALASLVLLARATGADPAHTAGTDLGARLAATGPAAPVTEAADAQAPAGHKAGEAGVSAALVATLALLVGAAAAITAAVLVRRRPEPE